MKKHSPSNEHLDRLGRDIVRAASAPDMEVAEAALAAPFLYARLQARLRAEREGREARDQWFNLLAVARRAVPAMAFSVIVAFGLFWAALWSTTPASLPGVEAFLSVDYSEAEIIVFADRRAPSQDEVLATILRDNEMPEVER